MKPKTVNRKPLTVLSFWLLLFAFISNCWGQTTLVTQGFNSTSIPAGWSSVIVTNESTSPALSYVASSTSPTVTPEEGSDFVNFNSFSCQAGGQIRLYQSSSFSTVGYTTITVNFWWYEDNGYNTDNDNVTVQWSTNGSTWNNSTSFSRYSATNGWTSQSVVLPAGANGQATLYIAFLFTSAYGNNCSLDNVSVTGMGSVINSFPWCESFDGATFAPTSWTNTNISGTILWQRITTSQDPSGYGTHSGAGMADFNSYSYNVPNEAILVTPALNVTGSYSVGFWMFRDGTAYLSTADLINIYYNTSPNKTGATLLGTINRSISLAPIVGATGWYQYTYNLPSNANLYVIFDGVSAYGDDMFLDDVCVQSACTAPTLSIAQNPNPANICNGSSATLTASGTGTSYLWAPGGATTAAITVSPAVTTVYTVTSTLAGCTATANVTVTVNAKSADPTSVTASVNPTCGGSTVLTLNGGGGGGNEVIQWYSGSCGGTAVGTGNGLSVTPAATTTYYGRYEDGAPCSYNSACQSLTITVNSLPVVAAIGGGAASVGVGNSTPAFTDATGGGTWSITNGTGSATITAGGVATGVTIGTVTVNYAVTNACGTTTVTYPLTVSACTAYAGMYTIPGSFATLTAAAAALHTCGISAPVQLVLNSYTGAGETYPILFQSIPGSSSTNTVTIYENAGGTSITSASATGTLSLNGCQYVIFDGRVNATGATRDLQIINTNAAGYAIQFINNASNNAVQYCLVQGQSTGSNGVIYFNGTSTTTGNNGNFINNCDINCMGLSPMGITSTGSATYQNTSDSIKNCSIHDFFNTGWTVNSGIYLTTGSTAWTISGNSFYQTSSRAPGASLAYYCIAIFNTSGNGFTINQNHIGGSTGVYVPATGDLGGTWTLTGATPNTLLGILVDVGNTTPTNIQGNIIDDFSIATQPAAIATTIFVGIEVNDGSVNIGTTNKNIIGSDVTAGVITINYSNPSSVNYTSFIIGITTFNTSASDVVNIGSATRGNIISGISLTGTNTTSIAYMNLIRIANTNTSMAITNNQVGNGVANCMSNVATVVTDVVGIIDQSTTGTGAITISNNYLANFTNLSTSASAYAWGIGTLTTSTHPTTITNNTISTFSYAGINTGTGVASGLIGINWQNTAAGQTISNNNINNLSSTTAGAIAVNVDGIVYASSPSGTISDNLIYNLNLSSSSTAATINGIYVKSGVANTYNNMITFGNGLATGYVINGINHLSTTANNNYYFNSVYIGGTVAAGSSTNAFYSSAGTATRTVENNSFYNARSGGGILHYAINVSSTNRLNI